MHCTRISKLCKEDILSSLHELSSHLHGAADRSLPEREIEHMMQSEWDQRAFDNTKDQGPKISCPGHQSAKGIDSVLYERPEKIHRNAAATYVIVEMIGTNLDPPKNESAFGSWIL